MPSRREFFQINGGALAARASAAERTERESSFIWCEEPQRRIFPHTVGCFHNQAQLALEACPGERVSAQIAIRDVKALHEWNARLESSQVEIDFRSRAVGLVPCLELGMLTPDPLMDSSSLDADPQQTRARWLDFQVPRGTRPGRYSAAVGVYSNRTLLQTVPVRLEVVGTPLPAPQEFDFFLSIWQDPAAIARYDRTPLWSERHWTLIDAYARNAANHGQKTITATVVEDPWASQTSFPFPSMVTWRHSGEWTQGGHFRFDYTIFDRYVETWLRHGVRTINCFSPTHWGTFAYYDDKAGKTRYKKYDLGDQWYAAAWNQFLPDLIGHLKQKGWLEQTYLAMDEAPHAIMEKVWPLIRRYSSDLKVHLAGGGGNYGKESEDLCYYYFSLLEKNPQIPRPDPDSRRREGKRTTLYVCTGPTHPNTFIYSPASGARMLPWLVWKHGYDGFLRWAMNSWTERVWQQPRYRWGSGDMFLVYPGANGPQDSMRWELLFAGIQDYQCLKSVDRMLKERESSRPGSTKPLRDRIDAAVEFAVGNEDPLITHEESRIARARRRVNQVFRELGA